MASNRRAFLTATATVTAAGALAVAPAPAASGTGRPNSRGPATAGAALEQLLAANGRSGPARPHRPRDIA
ncbi:carbonic anhydrase, partial [Streptomyces sp. NPDC048279]